MMQIMRMQYTRLTWDEDRNMKIAKEYGARLRAWRKEKKITQNLFSATSGLPVYVISGIENGTIFPNSEDHEKINKTLGYLEREST